MSGARSIPPGGREQVLGTTPVTWDGVSVSIISKDDLIAIKRASGPPQDLLDLETLEVPAKRG